MRAFSRRGGRSNGIRSCRSRVRAGVPDAPMTAVSTVVPAQASVEGMPNAIQPTATVQTTPSRAISSSPAFDVLAPSHAPRQRNLQVPAGQGPHFRDRQWVQVAHVSKQASAQQAALHHRGLQQPLIDLDPFRFKFMTFNVLSEHYARHYKHTLYAGAPSQALQWQNRADMLSQELTHWSADIIALQEVDRDHYAALESLLTPLGYVGEWLGRGGRRRDGCATFWKSARLKCAEVKHVRFHEHQLEDNVGLLVRLEVTDTAADDDGVHPGQLVVANTHVCFDPQKGDIKLGQIRVLFNAAAELAAAHNAHVLVGGDFNTSAYSPLYRYMAHGYLDLAKVPRKKLSGQVKGWGYPEYFAAVAKLQQQQALQAAVEAVGGHAHASSAQGHGSSGASGEDAGRIPDPDPPSPRQAAADSAEGTNGNGHGGPAAATSLPTAEPAPRTALSTPLDAAAAIPAVLVQPQPRDEGLRSVLRGGPGAILRAAVNTVDHLVFKPPRRSEEAHTAAENGWGARALRTALGAVQAHDTAVRQRLFGHAPSVLVGSGSTTAPVGTGPGGIAPGQVDLSVSTAGPSAAAPSSLVPGSQHAGGRQPVALATLDLYNEPGGDDDEAVIATHPLPLLSTYVAVTGQEPAFTTTHSGIHCCCDFLWFTQLPVRAPTDTGGAPSSYLAPVQVLAPPPMTDLPRGLPAVGFGSDHIALVGEYELLRPV